MIEVGVPLWTTGVFRRASAVDDLGIESVGAGLLRRLLPGIIQLTPNARYYSFYPFLLDEWERTSDSVAVADFRPFYRRQEVAFALACLLHAHRGQLVGVNGSIKATAALATGDEVLNVEALAADYMQSSLGGYGLYYARALQDMRLTQAGLGRRVDRVTDLGRRVAEAFRAEVEETVYYREYFDEPLVPREVLVEFGQRMCLCALPGAQDHLPLLEAFFGAHDDDPGWDERRKTRSRSIRLFLDFHDQRPEQVDGSLRTFRSCLASRSFPDRTRLVTPSSEMQESWRAYQLREVEVLALTSIWSTYLDRLLEGQPISRAGLVDGLASVTDWESVGFTGDATVESVLAVVKDLDGQALVNGAYEIADLADEPGAQLARAIHILLALVAQADDTTAGFVELLDEGGPGRWSLAHLETWTLRRSGWPLRQFATELLDALHDLHLRTAVEKLSFTDGRDPFCIADEDGMLTLIRPDAPFWTDSRFWVLNHLLWTFDLIDEPTGDARLTSRGREIATKIASDA